MQAAMPIGSNSPPPSRSVAATSFTSSGDGQVARVCRIALPCLVTGALLFLGTIPPFYGVLALVAIGAPATVTSLAQVIDWLKPKP